MKFVRITIFITLLCIAPGVLVAQWVKKQPGKGLINLRQFSICVDANDGAVVKTAALLLQEDIERVTGYKPAIQNNVSNDINQVIIGSIARSPLLKEFISQQQLQKKIKSGPGVWESGEVLGISSSSTGKILVIGSDARGAAFATMELSRQLGVSPWYWWADVPVVKQEFFVDPAYRFYDIPKVKYRGIFINDEAPALSGWSREKFGGFNSRFYRHVFELMLRLKANYIWPAMWGNAFYDDDKKNIDAAKEYGIVIGTSHHEPMMRAHDEWRRYGNGLKWNYDSTTAALQQFWRKGMTRAANEKIVTVGMRGDGDEPMSRETATTLLEKIVTDQRKIIEEVTGKPAAETPQLWALYKEVQDYYDKGMRVPDDVTLLLCDDNWGNLRRVPDLEAPPRKGGYGIYYHFDYVGGPRNYKWINTNPLPRIWEQMHLAWQYHVKDIWIVNVGDIKPMEFPISFFLDYAWNPDRIDINDLQEYSRKWAAAQFGETYAAEIAGILSKYAKYNSRRKPEMLDAKTYSLQAGEWSRVATEYNQLLEKAKEINEALPPQYRDAYFQLVLHPVWASANLNEMYFHVALNHDSYQKKSAETNTYANKVKQLYMQDSLITKAYHELNGGKWNHMMSQVHIGYTYWQQPPVQRMPDVKYVPVDSILLSPAIDSIPEKTTRIPASVKGNVFFESSYHGVSINADHYTRITNSNGISWKILPDLGRTGSSVTAFPVTAPPQKPGSNGAYVSYDIYTSSTGEVRLDVYVSPTLNIHNKPGGLQYAISIDDEKPQVISINKEDKNTGSGIWDKWVGENIIIKSSRHKISRQGKHTVKFWVVDPGVVLQKIVLDFGNNTPGYLGPPETIYQHQK